MYDPSYIAKQSEKEIAKNKDNSFKVEPSSNTYKAMTLFEFENGMLMSSIMEEQYRTFALDFSRNLQEEFE
ncbi:hypothetical protein COW99_03800 [Candidatus Roizmanbacteria bacterium CG22_combo_CG10-13_8_21_14_all_38_20]|uniref:Uncharacterized protein n=1 Tax=Candidatus Roizmanbacteria bacterium CG22_combo_CG10-13_8_21_14_all_38_20 TaxID=1974862 RepID=A0A2H0BV17_9BACT|nr:hypothetical protein [Candidatus Microgenomates bacterium]PIP61515.1 MAG: hypothetical protein COW99_03800 [Candidatus Roizmanbacteria bacterium CG22_combo_CG10-13_8_21_14_all_38_20]